MEVQEFIFNTYLKDNILTLNNESRKMMYDLAAMTFKYQLLCGGPLSYLHISNNHLNGLYNLPVDIEPQTKKVLSKLSLCNFDKKAITDFFAKLNIKISLLLKEEVQNTDGTFKKYPKEAGKEMARS
tara:strand:+ start:1249 stop:1629 length:381 start_codon:yes stop_codon:yes gene_type:complete